MSDSNLEINSQLNCEQVRVLRNWDRNDYNLANSDDTNKGSPSIIS